jgi:hypothetical protein
MNRISKIIQWLLALILLSTSLWVFIKNQTLRKQIKELNHVQIKLSHLEKLLSDSRYMENFLGKLFPRIEIADVVAGESKFTSFNDYTLVMVFSVSDCEPCLADALKILNEYYIEKNTSVKNKLINIGYAQDKLPLLKYRKITNAEFPFYIDVDGAIFQQLNITTGPLVFLVDSQNRITNAYYITPANLPQFESFLKTFDRFLNSR